MDLRAYNPVYDLEPLEKGDKIFNFASIALIVVSGILVLFGGFHVLKNPFWAHTFELIFTFSIHLYIMFAALHQLAHADIDIPVYIPSLVSIGSYAVVVILSRLLISGSFNMMYFIGPELAGQSLWYIPDPRSWMIALSMPLAFVVEFVVLKIVSKATWSYLLPAYGIYFIGSIVMVYATNLLLFFALYNTALI